jgi:hypothetical protein
MKILALLLLLPAEACLAQAPYRYVVDTPIQLGPVAVPAYRSFADTTGKPSLKLFRNSSATVVGRVGTRWAVLRQRDSEYLVRTRDLPLASAQAAVAAAQLLSLPLDSATGRIQYTAVVPVPEASQVELYARAQLWFADTFGSTRRVVQVADQAAGVLQGTAFYPLVLEVGGSRYPQQLWYTVKLVLKDGRYRYEFTDFYLQAYPDPYAAVPAVAVPAEAAIEIERQRGTARNLARATRREMLVAGTVLTAALQAGMSKPVAGPVAGRDW